MPIFRSSSITGRSSSITQRAKRCWPTCSPQRRQTVSSRIFLRRMSPPLSTAGMTGSALCTTAPASAPKRRILSPPVRGIPAARPSGTTAISTDPTRSTLPASTFRKSFSPSMSSSVGCTPACSARTSIPGRNGWRLCPRQQPRPRRDVSWRSCCTAIKSLRLAMR